MQLLAALHVHPAQAALTDDCVKCMTHQSHDGHFRVAQFSMHDCLLCQVLHLPFIPVAMGIVLVVFCSTRTVRQVQSRRVVFTLGGAHGLRAPPAC